MSSVCAKPSCAEPVQVWLDFAPAARRVIERADRGDATIGLCEAHGKRFSVPNGWTFDRLSPSEAVPDSEESEPTESLDEAEPASSHAGTNRSTRRGRPWFLTDADEVEPEPTDDGSTPPDDDPVEHALSAGSLLHRAFHGPDRKSDRHRAELDELERRRAARADENALANPGARASEDVCGTIALPFPPFGSEQRIAVS